MDDVEEMTLDGSNNIVQETESFKKDIKVCHVALECEFRKKATDLNRNVVN